MSFVTQTGSKQYIVDEGQRFAVDFLKDVEPGDIIELPVLFTFGKTKNTSSVQAKVVGHEKGEKLRIVKYKAKSNYHRQYGFRAHHTVLELVSGATTTKKTTPKSDTEAKNKEEVKEETKTKAAPKKTTKAKTSTK